MTGHPYTKGQVCLSRRDTFSVDGNTTTDVNIVVNRDLLTSIGLPNGSPIPNVPTGPGGALGTPGGSVPRPDFGADSYSMVFRLSDVKGTDHFEDRPPPTQTCPLSTGDQQCVLQPAVGTYFKQLNPDEPDHLKDSETVQQRDTTITMQWDLTR